VLSKCQAQKKNNISEQKKIAYQNILLVTYKEQFVSVTHWQAEIG